MFNQKGLERTKKKKKKKRKTEAKRRIVRKQIDFPKKEKETAAKVRHEWSQL